MNANETVPRDKLHAALRSHLKGVRIGSDVSLDAPQFLYDVGSTEELRMPDGAPYEFSPQEVVVLSDILLAYMKADILRPVLCDYGFGHCWRLTDKGVKEVNAESPHVDISI